MIKSTLKASFLLALAFVTLSNKGGRNAPSTGAPFENNGTCAACHGGGNFETNIDIQLINNKGVITNTYSPNETYEVVLKMTNTGGNTPKSYGFQMVMVDSTTQGQAGAFKQLGTNVRKSNFDAKEYIMQSVPREDGTYTAMWTAPDKGTGPLSIYISALATNGNGNTNGDRVVATSFTISESLISSNKDVVLDKITFYPNPTQGSINFSSEVHDVYLYTLGGQLIGNWNDTQLLDVSHLSSGIYWIKLDDQAILSLIKQ